MFQVVLGVLPILGRISAQAGVGAALFALGSVKGGLPCVVI